MLSPVSLHILIYSKRIVSGLQICHTMSQCRVVRINCSIVISNYCHHQDITTVWDLTDFMHFSLSIVFYISNPMQNCFFFPTVDVNHTNSTQCSQYWRSSSINLLTICSKLVLYNSICIVKRLKIQELKGIRVSDDLIVRNVSFTNEMRF